MPRHIVYVETEEKESIEYSHALSRTCPTSTVTVRTLSVDDPPRMPGALEFDIDCAALPSHLYLVKLFYFTFEGYNCIRIMTKYDSLYASEVAAERKKDQLLSNSVQVSRTLGGNLISVSIDKVALDR